MLWKWLTPIAAFFVLVVLRSHAAAGDKVARADSFEKTVLPIFQAKCFSCHGAKKQKAGLDMRSRAGMLKGGESGPALVAGDASKSLLWELIDADKMPQGKDKLTAAEKATVRRWIEAGAPAADKTPLDTTDRQVTDEDRDFWSFKKPVRPALPDVKTKNRIANPIDSFLLKTLEKKGLTYSPPADSWTLLRRLAFDLTGLPPTPQEMDDFLADKTGRAYENAVDRYLASPHYGERWGRHWLDLAGYADSEGILDADYVRTAAWRYRDWVIRAMNQDKPYDQFLREQIAGDELVDYWTAFQTQKELSKEVVEALEATGFLRCASDTSRPDFNTIKNAPGYYFQTLDDTLKIVSSATLGLTLQCAKCHSHKYDPISQTDYYRVQAIFMSGYRPSQWIPQVERRLLEGSAAQIKETTAHNARIDQEVAVLQKQVAELRRPFADKYFADSLAKLPAQIRDDVKTALNADPKKRNEVQKYLVSKFQADLKPGPEALHAKLLAYPDYQAQFAELDKKGQALARQKRTLPEIRAFYDLPGQAKTHLLRRGDYLQPGPEVQPGTLAVLVAGKPFTHLPPSPQAKTSGIRLAFARWLTQPDHPLTARVLVNRLWLHHFGQGIVATPDNFGKTGAPPSHPELLDWLATELVAKQWSMKAMHRLMVTSQAYRQNSALDPLAHAQAKLVDPDNRLLWRQRLRRLEGEPLRDAVLAVAGKLNPRMFGPPVPMVRRGNGEIVTPADSSGDRRSVYLQVRRSQPLTFLQLFDQPVIETNCTRREVSTVASQALTLLNSEFMQVQAAHFADRVLKEAADRPAAHAVRLAFARNATARETTLFQAFLDQQTVQHLALMRTPSPDQRAIARRQALTDLCHMLLSANEFAYLD